MSAILKIALVGDHDPAITAHRAIPLALDIASRDVDRPVTATWVATDEIVHVDRLRGFDAVWAVPGSPYRSMAGALLAIRHARENGIPFLGTCGGFQHAVVEYARNVLGWHDAEHGETVPDAPRAVITPLSCSLVEASGPIRFIAGSGIAAIYGQPAAEERYRCRFGLNPTFREALVAGPMKVGATDDLGDVRAIELDGHPFFIATLFQPERAALEGQPHRLVRALLRATAAKESSCC